MTGCAGLHTRPPGGRTPAGTPCEIACQPWDSNYNVTVPRVRLRGFIFLIAAAVALIVARGGGQDAGLSRRSYLYPYPLSAVDQGLMRVETPDPGRRSATSRGPTMVPAATRDRTGRSGAPYAAGTLIVKFRDGASTAARLKSLSIVTPAASVSERPSNANFDLVRIDPNEDAEAAAEALRLRPDVEYAQPAYRVHSMFVPNDPYYQPYQWNLPMLDLERAWDIQRAAGSAVTVAVLDTGVAFESAVVRFDVQAFTDDLGVAHPAGTVDVPFAAATELFAPGRFVQPHDFIWDDDLPLDLDGHGTHVSGTVGQLTNNGIGTAGVAFNVKLMPVKVISTDWDDIFSSPNQGTDDVVARGIRYAADNGARIINMSIGRTGPPAPVIEDAIRYAVGKGTFIVIAAGNDFEDGNPTEVLAEIASRVNGAVSVAAVDRERNHAYYSSSGSWVELSAPGGSFRGFGAEGGVLQQTLDLAFSLPSSFSAPRFDIFAYYYFTGTSQAAPHVAGLAAMLYQQGITRPAAIEAALEKFATDLGDPGRDDMFGYGLVEARDTLRGLGLAK